MSKNKQDNHGGARSGVKGEKLLKEKLEKHGFSLLKKKGDFAAAGQPEAYYKFLRMRCPYSEEGYFETDGYCPQLNTVFEMKYGTAHGTTEEKIMFDLEKIRDGVYPTDSARLRYVFWGTPEVPRREGLRCVAQIFADKVKKENLPVEVVFAETDDGWDKFIEREKERLTT